MVHLHGISIGREIVRRESLQVPVKSPKRRRRGISSRGEVSKARYAGHVWSYDFIFERTEDGKTLKFLTIVDEFSRVALSLSCGRTLTGLHVIRTLQTLLPVWGATDCLRSDNGSEFVARQVKKWFLEHGIGTHYIDPVSPWQIHFIESFNSIFRTTFLNRCFSLTLAETKALTRQWLEEYNEIRRHGYSRRFIATPIPTDFP